MKVIPNVATGKAIVRNPARALRGENRVPASILLFAGIVALASYRRGRLPVDQEWIPILIAAAAIVVAANVAPDVVTLLLIAAVVVTLLQDADGIAKVIARGGDELRAALTRVGVPA